jgi:hypothetical protein
MRHRVLVVAGEFRQVAVRRCGAWCGSLRSQHACNLVGARGHAVSVDLEDLSQITRNFQDVAVAAITGMSGTVSSAIRKRMRMMSERAVTARLDAAAKIGQPRIAKCKPLQARVARLTKYGPNAIPGEQSTTLKIKAHFVIAVTQASEGVIGSSGAWTRAHLRENAVEDTLNVMLRRES